MFFAFVLSLVIGSFFGWLTNGMNMKHVVVGWVMIICALVSAMLGYNSGALVGAIVWGMLAGTVSFLCTGRKRAGN